MTIGLPEILILAVVAVVVVLPVSRICKRAGFSPWLGLATLVPAANVLLLWYLAFAEWPRDRGPAQ
jgi:hypothetical protein